ncbi:uncharacterized protein HKW66_Vig0238230 [Vigna angularis]|uniref:Uncharacterized protein n=1 Tax=Phaseolus angularis TaxID=3914 RepID=A0A8T0KSE0_PHAAN|nr:uncharacterized protein HKW66_Vig0238230 [Vigna angularis]
MKFLDWYLKIGFVSALVGASMEVFMIKTGFCVRTFLSCSLTSLALHYPFLDFPFNAVVEVDDKVTVLESEKRAWENSPDAQAIREALNPWRHIDAEDTKKS